MRIAASVIAEATKETATTIAPADILMEIIGDGR